MSNDAATDDRRRPDDYTLGRITPEFTAETVPPALLKSHRAATWAELVVFEGSVDFHELEPAWKATATPDRPISIVPDRQHEITPSADARFAVQFYDAPDLAPG